MWGAQGVAEDCAACNRNMQHRLEVGKRRRCRSGKASQGFGGREVLRTGKCCFKFLQTPHVPHAWDAGHLFEENSGILLCSDLFHQNGDVEEITNSEVVTRFKETLIEYQKGPFANYLPYTARTDDMLSRLAALKPEVIAPMHGSTYVGDGEAALFDLAQAMKEVLAGPP